MPEVDRFDGLRIVIYPNDHRPAHVHVIGSGREAVFILHCPDGPPELRETYGFGASMIRHVKTALGQRLHALCAEWRRLHGD